MNFIRRSCATPATGFFASKAVFFFIIFTAHIFILPLGSISAEVTAEGVYSGHEKKILQVRIIDKASGAKAAIGSGFVVSADGLVLSNYHVVSELINRPGRYRAEFSHEDGSGGELILVDIDVIHDLALLKSEQLGNDLLVIADTQPVKGERLFSLGNPLDLGMTIVEGTYNGLRARTLYEKIHFTGSINPGMSGGPTLNKKGEVVGVNVSTAGNQVSFLVPAKFVRQLLKRKKHGRFSPKQLLDQVRDQLMENQQQYVDYIFEKSFPLIEMGEFSLPGQLAPFMNCWGDTHPKNDSLYEIAHHSCSSSDDFYLSRMHSSGIIRFRHELFTTSEIGRIRFYSMLEERFQDADIHMEGDEDNFTNYQCETDFVEHNDLDSKVVFCMRGYRKLAGLYDVFMTTSTLVSGEENLQSTLVMSGVSYDNGVKFGRSFIESISRRKNN